MIKFKNHISALLAVLCLLGTLGCQRVSEGGESSRPVESDTPITDRLTETDAPNTDTESEIVPSEELFSVGLEDESGERIADTVFEKEKNTLYVRIPFASDEGEIKNARPFVEGENATLVSFTDIDENEVTSLSFRQKYILTVSIGTVTRPYYLKIGRQSNDLPMVSLYTDGEITSKFEYISGSMSIDTSCGGEYLGYDLEQTSLQIKGRGNASWWGEGEKKSYRIKSDEKVSVLGLAKNRDWVLVPNYYDKTLMRNIVAHTLASQMECLYYTPTHIPVDLFLNGEYRGVYTIADKIEVAGGKVELGNTKGVDSPGFFIEMGWDFNEKVYRGLDYFDTKMLERLFVKQPEITKRYGDDINYIIDYVQRAEDAIVSGVGYEEYIDIDAFVDWFIITELTNNTEMAFYRSCFFYKPEGGKITMGPVWDFDMAFGNHKGDIKNYDGWASGEATYYDMTKNWATYLVKDEHFMSLVRKRWCQKRDVLLSCAESTIDNTAKKLERSQKENFKKWDIMDKTVGVGNVDCKKYNTYELQVQYLRNFIISRAEWIDGRLGVERSATAEKIER